MTHSYTELSTNMKINPDSDEYKRKWSAIYHQGTADGRKLAIKQVYSTGDTDVWIIVATCLFMFCIIAIAFMRKAKASLEKIEAIREDATVLMQIKEKELVAEQAQVCHLQSMHQEYISKCQKQIALINSLREKRLALLQIASEENAKLHTKCRTVSSLRHDRRLKNRIYLTAERNKRRLKHTLMHTMYLISGAVYCGTMWLSYNIGYLIG